MINNISLNSVLSKLGLIDAPAGLSLSLIREMNHEKKLPIYFSGELIAAEPPVTPEPLFDSCDGECTGLLLASKPITISGEFSMEHVLLVKDGEQVWVSTYEVTDSQNRTYYASDESGMFAKTFRVSSDDFYFKADEVSIYADYFSTNQTKKSVSPKGEPGLRKAIALLAHDMAKNKARFRTGNKVNASQLKEHIINLAIQHDISRGYLNSLDDKIRSCLNDFDLRDISSDK